MKSIKKILVSVLALVVLTTMLSASAFASIGKAIYIDGKATMYTGQTQTLSFYYGGTKITNKTWKSSNTGVATVSTKGKVTAKKAGKVTITAKEGKGKTSFTITVKKKPSLGTTTVKAANDLIKFDSGITRNGINITWTKASYATGYKVYKKRADGVWQLIGTWDSATRHHMDTNVELGKKYSYKVCPVRNSYEGPGVIKSIYRVPATHLREPKVKDGTVELGWTPQSTAEGYKIYRQTDDGDLVLLTKIEDGKANSFTDTTAEPGHSYRYNIRCYISTTNGRLPAEDITEAVTIE